MKKLIISLSLIVCNFMVSPSKAEDDFVQRAVDANIGRKLGWLEASCALLDIGWLNEIRAKTTINTVLKHNIGGSSDKLFKGINKELFKAFAKNKFKARACKKLFPPNFFN